MGSASGRSRSSSGTTPRWRCSVASGSTMRRATTRAARSRWRTRGPRPLPSMYARHRLSELTDRLRTAYEGFGRGDMDAILSVMDPDIEWDATDALAHTGVYQGHEGVTDYIGSLSAAWDEFHLFPEQFTESGDGQHVMVLG